MTWKQQSGRNFVLSDASTPPSVGPGSYTIPGTELRATQPRGPKRKFRPRETLPPPDFITPGPGAYNSGEDSVRVGSHGSSVFMSKAARSPSAGFITPSSADYGEIRNWGKGKVRRAPANRPSRLQSRSPSANSTCNFLDESGRLIRVHDGTRTEADIGPGTYTDMRVPCSRSTLISSTERRCEWAEPTAGPSPDTYIISTVDTRLPCTIKGQYPSKPPTALCDRLIAAPQKKMDWHANSVFQSRSRRDMSLASHADVPGPGQYSPVDRRKEVHEVDGCGFGSRAVQPRSYANGIPGPSDYTVEDRRPPSTMSFQFTSKTVKRDQPQNTPDIVGPGSYNVDQERRTCPRKSPAFADGSTRDRKVGNDNPSPADYTVKTSMSRAATVLNTRYPNHGNWLLTTNCAPSPERYQIDREMRGTAYTIPRARVNKQRRKEKVGPGSYNVTSSMIKPSYNACVPTHIRY